MDEYMRENKLDGIAPVVPRPAPVPSAPKKASDAESEEDVPEEDAPPAKKQKGHSGH